MRDSNNSRCQPTLCTLPFVCNLAWLCFNLGCLLFLCSVSFVFKIYRLLFPSLLGFVHLDCLSCTRSASFVFLTRLVDSFARSRWRILLSCRLLGCIWIAPAFVFVPRSVLSFRPPPLFPTNISFVFDHGQTIKIAAQLGWVPRSCTPRYCSTRFWWRVLLSCRLARLDLNTIQLSISSKIEFCEGFTGRISSFWTSPGRFRRIVAIYKSGVGDVWMQKTPGVALWGEKPRRKYYGSLHLTRWTAHLETKTYFILALYRTPSRQQCYSSRSVNEGDFWRDSWRFLATGLNWAAA